MQVLYKDKPMKSSGKTKEGKKAFPPLLPHHFAKVSYCLLHGYHIWGAKAAGVFCK